MFDNCYNKLTPFTLLT